MAIVSVIRLILWHFDHKPGILLFLMTAVTIWCVFQVVIVFSQLSVKKRYVATDMQLDRVGFQDRLNIAKMGVDGNVAAAEVQDKVRSTTHAKNGQGQGQTGPEGQGNVQKQQIGQGHGMHQTKAVKSDVSQQLRVRNEDAAIKRKLTRIYKNQSRVMKQEGQGSDGLSSPEEAFANVQAGQVAVAIVEEHHDVIPWWFEALEQGFLPPHGNLTLLHVDAHKDGALPSFVDGNFPLFRVPTKRELQYLMQKNSMFIAASAIAGLYNRVIWLAPQWDPNHGLHWELFLLGTGYMRFHILTGVVTELESARKPEHERLCQCMVSTVNDFRVMFQLQVTMLSKKTVEIQDFEAVKSKLEQLKLMASTLDYVVAAQKDSHVVTLCFRWLFTQLDSEWMFTQTVPASKCQPRVHALFEMVTENVALSLLGINPLNSEVAEAVTRSDFDIIPHLPGKEGANTILNLHTDRHGPGSRTSWLNPKEHVLLDIDEDYFGVGAGITPLEEVGLMEEDVRKLSKQVSIIFCAENASEENQANDLFKGMLHIVRILCHKDPVTVCQGPKKDTRSVSSTILTYVFQQPAANSVLCRGGKVIRFTVPALVNTLMNLEEVQLERLAQIGVCLTHSPNSLHFNETMTLCFGFNTNRNTVVSFYAPDDLENVHLQTNLAHILTNTFRPTAVTVARSVRDGYTLRHRQQKTEQGLLNILKTSIPGVSDKTVFYDRNLLGGREGWEKRSRSKE